MMERNILLLPLFIAMLSCGTPKTIEREVAVPVMEIHHDTVMQKEYVSVVDSVWIVDTIIQYADGKERSARYVYHSRNNDKSSEDKSVSKDNEQKPVYLTVTKEKKVMDVRLICVTALLGVVLGISLVIPYRRVVRFVKRE